MGVRRAPNPIAPVTGIGPAASGSQTVTGNIPVGATANFVKNGSPVGAANVSALGIATYGPVTLVAGDSVAFAWSLTGTTPAAKVPGSAPVYVPPPDPAIAAASAQSSSRSSEVSSASNDNGRSGSGAGPYTALARPTISGKPYVGQTLVGYPGLWDAAAGLTYRWRVNGTAGSAMSRTYTAVNDGDVVEFGVVPNNGTTAWSQPVTVSVGGPILVTETGAILVTENNVPIEANIRAVRWLAPYSATQSVADKLADPKVTAYTHAVTDTDIFVTASSLPISLYAQGAKLVTIWHSGAVQLSLVPDVDGYCQGILPLSGIPNGALTIEAHALADNSNESFAVSAVYAQITVILRGGSAPTIPATPTAAAGLTLAFEDTFSAPLSVSYANTRPTGVKWYGSMAFDKNGYGDAIFVDPTSQYSQCTIIDSMLRMRVLYDPTKAAAVGDPYNRKWLGACLTSSFPDGSTSLPAMGDGYYECRMLCPIGIGTWPAFWLNDQSSLLLKAAGTPSPNGRETDIVEQYNETVGYVATQHRYQKNASGTNIDPSTGFNVAADKGKMGWKWYRFGCLMDSANNKIVYYLDDQVVATDNSFYKPAGQSDPTLNHIIITAALNGGWPVAVPPGGYYDTYFDYVRYWKKAA